MAFYLLHANQPSARRLIRRVPRLCNYRASNAITESDVVLRWGPAVESDPVAARVLNARRAVERTVSRVYMGKLLRRAGIRFPTREQLADPTHAPTRFVRHFRIPVFDLQPIACFQAEAEPLWLNRRIQRVSETFTEVALDDDPAAVRAKRLAVRALHALGLDFGLVSMGMNAQGFLYVVDVTPSPVLEGRLLELFAEAVEQFITREEMLARDGFGPVRMGADIELMLRNAQGKMVLASKFLPRKGRVGCDDRSVRYDGQRLPLMELRPDPDTNPLVLLENLRQTMVEAASAINRSQIEWRAGSSPFRPYTTGGHLHFSGVPLSSHLVRVLDNYVGLPLMMVENHATARQRRPRYGFLGDVRMKKHGGFEYRTPASFVVDPDITAAALCLAHLVVSHHRTLPVWDIYEPSLQAAFYDGDPRPLWPVFERTAAAVRSLPGYERYRDHIEPLYRMIEAGATWNEDVDVRAVWNIPVVRAASARSHPARSHPARLGLTIQG
ncbi:hypothetical protein GCM10010885_12040 [Alicyclobacillus cellulosilyticus]|uniref:PhiEco32-like amidoligase-type 2 protein n=1 Tax=Alicyclobacillus cellulosilyticus TaxID=1003997 RepID=A0A917K8T8_9BACL|nr:hypothetical protein [Alicyclobacillus cellulosilyticus]GGJ04395.1 hypothetical protein GCM10010885_12040 [Alicyclobacillus cellulosilyticus]